MTELVLSVTGHPLLAYNSFTGHWRFGQGLCEVNAFSMTYLGELKINYLSTQDRIGNNVLVIYWLKQGFHSLILLQNYFVYLLDLI